MPHPVFFDLSSWRRLLLSGPDRRQFLQGLVTNDVLKAAPRQPLACCLLTPKGKLQAHFWCYALEEALLLVCPDGCAANLRGALEKVIKLSESSLEDASARWAQAWVGGPWDGGGADWSLPFSELGEPGALAFFEPSRAAAMEPALGRRLSAREFERRRIERGLPAFGVDTDGDTIPLEARLDRAISYTKGCYMGQETISRIHHMGHVNRLLAGLSFEGPPPAAPAAVTLEGGEIGRLTSACLLPSGRGLGLATIRAEHAVAGARLAVGQKSAVVVDLWEPRAA